ncbi:MAG TPA: hypothetical protein VM009_06560, partial [Terriglobales bacterium]|nr:hypothetical protein [Terriglobales bacterium]
MSACAFAQAERAIMQREANIFVSPDVKSQKLGKVTRGREVVLLETSRNFIKVLGELDNDRNVSGWILDKGIIRTSTPNGDKILFGEAVDSENEASRRGGRRGADKDALRLYYRTAEYFPKSDIAGEALWRAADIRWQLDKADVNSRKSAKEMDPRMRGEMPDEWMKEVQKKFPNTKWADLATYARLDTKLCGEWQGLAKCPENESEMYEKYVKEHPQSPKAGEALYEAAWRQAALIEIYRERSDAGKSGTAKAKARALAQQIIGQY